jgi:hypothetical protein
MSTSSPPGTRMEGRGGVDGFAESFWLAKNEMKRAWLSFVLTGVIVLFLGFFAAVSLSGGVSELEGLVMQGRRMQDFYTAFFADYLFLLVCAVLGANTISRYYTLDWRDTFSSRLVFFRSLPISTGSLVGSRVISMFFALVLNALAFFVPAFFLSSLGEELGTETYLWFCGVWIGYSLLGSGLCLLLEFSASGKAYALISYSFAVPLMVVVALLEWTADLGLVWRTAQLAQSSHGALPAVFSLLAGGVTFLLLSRITVHSLQKRDLSA